MSLHVFLSLMRAELCSYIGRGTAGSHGLYMPNFSKYRDYSAERVLKYKLPPLLIYMILSLSDFLFRYISTLLDTSSYDSSQNYVNSAIKKIKRHIIQRSTREIQFSCGVNSKTEAPSLSKYFPLIFCLFILKILEETGIPDHLVLLRKLYASQEATVRTGSGTTDWLQIGKDIRQGCILSPCLFNLYAEYIIWNARLDESQAGIKIAGRYINNLRYANDTTLMAENEEELKRLMMRVKEESEKAGLTPTFRKLRLWHSVLSLHGK